MPSSSRQSARVVAALVTAALAAWEGRAQAQCAPQEVPGFALDRLYLSAPGGGWTVMDTLDMHGGLGGAVGLTTEYAHDPLRVRTTDGSQRLTVVADEAIADFGFAATYDRWRLSVNLDMPLDIAGNGGTVGAYTYCAPNSGQPFTPAGVNPATSPDAFADGRIGLDVRILGAYESAFRLGAGAQLFVPSPNTYQSQYLTDGTFRAMGRILFAGDVDWFSYAGQIGIHLRPYSDAPVAGSPEGSELLFGAAAGWKYAVDAKRALIVGPEVYGETALSAFFGTTTTGVEGLVTARIEGTASDGPQIRVKLAAGGGLDAHFGAPEWRMVAGIELFDHSTDSDGDGVSDSKDACPRVPGKRTKDPKTNGCPPDRDGDGVPDAEDACPDVPVGNGEDAGARGCPPRPPGDEGERAK